MFADYADGNERAIPIVTVDSDTKLHDALGKYHINDSPDAAVLGNSDVVVVKKYGSFENKALEFLRSLG
jgi:hypothetical protein